MISAERKNEVMAEVVKVVKEYGGEGLSVQEIADLLSISRWTLYKYMDSFEDHDIVPVWQTSDQGRAVKRYVYKPKSAFKNAEGYTDMTAGQAIKNAEESTKKPVKIIPGAIYGRKWLVLKSFSDMVVYLDCTPLSEAPEYFTPMCVSFYIGYEEYYVNPHSIWSTPPRKIDISEKTVIDMAKWREIVGKAGMNIVEVPVEVPAEAPEGTEKAPETVAKPEVDLEAALLKQKAEIYENILFAMIGKNK